MFLQSFLKDIIGEIAFPQSDKLPKTIEGRKFYLSWSLDLRINIRI